jgi:hypothetical protein
MFRTITAILCLGLAACANHSTSGPSVPLRADAGTPVALNEPAWLEAPWLSIIPRAIIEDSRCPVNARCVWAGRVRIEADVTANREPESDEIRFHGPITTFRITLSSDQPTPIFGGTISLEDVQPMPVAGEPGKGPGNPRIVMAYQRPVETP